MCKAMGLQPDEQFPRKRADGSDYMSPPAWRGFELHARAAWREALAQLREPTQAMLEAAAATDGIKEVDGGLVVAALHGWGLRVGLESDTALVQSWRAMIAEAERAGVLAAPSKEAVANE